MTLRIVEVVCPECGELDTTQVDLDEERNDYFVTTECVTCTNPYAIRIMLRIEAKAYHLEPR